MRESGVETKRLRSRNLEPGEIRMRRIDQEVEFPRNDRAWHPNRDAAPGSRPLASESLSGQGIGIGPPGLGIPKRALDQSPGKRNSLRLPLNGAKVLNVLDVNQRLHRGQRPGFRAIDHPGSGQIPSPAVAKRTVTGNCRLCKAPDIEAPDRNWVGHENTPSSNLSRTASTSRAPGSVLAKSSGVRPPRTRSGRFSQRRVLSFVPSASFARS